MGADGPHGDRSACPPAAAVRGPRRRPPPAGLRALISKTARPRAAPRAAHAALDLHGSRARGPHKSASVVCGCFVTRAGQAQSLAGSPQGGGQAIGAAGGWRKPSPLRASASAQHGPHGPVRRRQGCKPFRAETAGGLGSRQPDPQRGGDAQPKGPKKDMHTHMAQEKAGLDPAQEPQRPSLSGRSKIAVVLDLARLAPEGKKTQRKDNRSQEKDLEKNRICKHVQFLFLMQDALMRGTSASSRASQPRLPNSSGATNALPSINAPAVRTAARKPGKSILYFFTRRSNLRRRRHGPRPRPACRSAAVNGTVE
jgi:hypothetical protein